MATLIQADLKELGMDVRVVPLEFRALVDRVFRPSTTKPRSRVLAVAMPTPTPR